MPEKTENSEVEEQVINKIASDEDSLVLTNNLKLTSNTLDSDEKRWKKSFGFVTARPHEYLLHMRRGKVQKKSSGHGSQCFKMPGDTVVIIPTSLKQLIFEASQLTVDNILVRIKGFAIYHISDPEKIYRHISFWNRSEGEKKLARIIGEPCRSYTKWLVANMTLTDAIRKRKEQIADVLLKELKLTLNNEELGVTIDIVDIQYVMIVDPVVFQAMQQPSTDDILLKQQMSELELKRKVELQRLKQEQEINEKSKENEIRKIANEKEISAEKISLENIKIDEERIQEKKTVEHDANISKFKVSSELERKKEASRINNEIAEIQLLDSRKLSEMEIESLERKEILELERKRKIELQNLKQRKELEEKNKENEIQKIKHAIVIDSEKRNLENAQLDEERKRDKLAAEHEASIAEYKTNKEMEQKKEIASVNSEISEMELEDTRKKAELELETLEQKVKIDNSFSRLALEKIYLSEVLPEVASAITSSLKNANLTVYQTPNESGGTPISMILNEALALLQNKFNKMDKEESNNK